MEFEKVDIDELIPAEYNPRKDLKPSDSEYQKIKKSIEEFGYVEPIIVNKDNTIIGGHQRLKVLKDLGYKEIDIIRIDIDKTKEKALNIALNKITGDWDYDKLRDVFKSMDELDLLFTGFDDWELENMLENVEYGLETESVELSIDEFEDKMDLKLVFTYDEYHFIIDKLREYDDEPSEALLKVFKYEE